MAELAILQKRRIEAEILGEVYQVLKTRDGKAAAREIIGAACSASAIAQGKAFAAELGQPPDLLDFADILPHWTKEDALEIEVLRSTQDHMDFNVTRCRYAETYAEIGLAEIGDLLSCNRDGDFCIGYNPQITLTRTQTIMQGAGYCDFRYRIGAGEKPD